MAITARLIQNLVHMKPEISLLPLRRLMRRLEDFGRDFVHRSGRILLPRAPPLRPTHLRCRSTVLTQATAPEQQAPGHQQHGRAKAEDEAGDARVEQTNASRGLMSSVIIVTDGSRHASRESLMSSVIIVTDGSRHAHHDASRESLWFCRGHVLLRRLRGPRQSGSTHVLLDQFCVRSSTSR